MADEPESDEEGEDADEDEEEEGIGVRMPFEFPRQKLTKKTSRERDRGRGMDAVKHAVSGTMGGSIALSLFYPLDILRTAAQLSTRPELAYEHLKSLYAFH